MKREDLYLTIEQCQHLQELGLDMSDAEHCWFKPYKEPWAVTMLCSTPLSLKPIPTYTLQEVLENLPRYLDDLKLRVGINHIYYVCMSSGKSVKGYRFSTISGFFKSAYYLLCWLLENKLLEEGKEC